MSKRGACQGGPQDTPQRLDSRLRQQSGGEPWSKVRKWIETGKVRVDQATVTDPALLVRSSQSVEVVLNAPRPATAQRLASDAVVFVDDQVVVVRKPAGISTIPFDKGERGTLHELVRAWLNRTADRRGDRATGDLGVVHRIDKETSGLLVFTRTLDAKRELAQQFRVHSVERAYLAVAAGDVRPARIESRLVADRGDGVRGSTRDPKQGQEAVTHVEPVQRLRDATLVRCRLETGRTHQIRIHLSEAGHPLLGERVYCRGFDAARLQAPRLMLHAAVLGFDHPTRKERVVFEEPMPEDMKDLVRQRGGAA